MEPLLIYLLKASGLIAMFYLAYHFLVRKETFFDGNRWFLLSGLATSTLLPLFFIKKIIVVERPKISMENLLALSKQTPINVKEIQAVEAFDWMQLLWIGYSLVAFVLVAKIVLNLFSLYRMLHKQHKFKRDQFTLIDLEDNTAPFSFFNYIVYNSSFYTDTELENIILHEQVHSKEHHSIDVLTVKLFCAIFWFNPFVWLYKKAITQNLEYIADQKAIQQLDDRQAYQHALLKVVSHQNCLSITNHFYQSLIKKRIVMLNTHQSHQRNSWKYAVIIPALIGFLFLFQVKVIAKDKFTTEDNNVVTNKAITSDKNSNIKQNQTVISSLDIAYYVDKISSDKELKSDATTLKKQYGIDYVISNLKRNSNGEIIAIKITFNDNKGNTGKTEQFRDIPIRPIFFKVSQSKEGKKILGFYDNPDLVLKPIDPINENKITTIEAIKDDALIYVDGERYDKESLNELDPKGLAKIEILTDSKSLTEYGAKDKNEVVVITTNWSTKPVIPKQNAPTIITLENGDEVVIFDRYNMKIAGYPSVTFTEKSPVLVVNGVQQKNPRLALERMDISKIKTIKALGENDKEVKGTPIYQLILTTK